MKTGRAVAGFPAAVRTLADSRPSAERKRGDANRRTTDADVDVDVDA